MYNESLKYIKEQQYYKSNNKPSFITIRNTLKDIKNEILNRITIPAHILDLSVKKCVENYKSLLSNFKKKNIDKFRIKYYKYKSNRKTLYLEPVYIRKNGFITQLGEAKLYDIESKKEYKIEKENIKNHFEIKYSPIEKEYYIIFIYKRCNKIDNKKKEDYISLDPGLSPFLTGVSKNNGLFIGENIYKNLNNKIDKIDKYTNSKLKPSKKVKYTNKTKKQINNKINDLHWKTINYLTTNYNKILIGDLSVKGIVGTNGISKKSKRIAHFIKLFVFKNRLKEKCEERGVEYLEINEYNTSKSCSICGNVKTDLRKKKLYDCTNCNNKIHRDINGARNIYFVSCI